MPQKSENFQNDEPRIYIGWLPFLVGILLCLLVLLLWKILEDFEKFNLSNKVQSESEYLASQIEADLSNRFPSLQRMVQRWEVHAGTPEEEFVMNARSYLEDVAGFQALEWVDKDGFVRWVIPFEGNEKVKGLNISFEENRRASMEKARNKRTPAMSKPIDLVQGGKGFLVFFPIFVKGESDGFILAVFRIQEWLDYVFSVKKSPLLQDKFRISVFIEDIPVYVQKCWENAEVYRLDGISQTEILDYHLRIHVRPTELFVKQNSTWLPVLLLFFGILLSVLVSLVVRLFQMAYAEAWKTHSVKKSLEAEVLNREKTEHKLQYTLAKMDLATRAGRMGVWSWNLATDKLTWNDLMFDLFDIPSDISPTYATWKNAVHSEDIEKTELLLKKAVEGKAVFDTEFRIVLSNGSVRNIRAAAMIERDTEGKALYVTGLNWDITNNKMAEEALKESEAKVRLLLNSTAEAIYGIDLNGNCIFANTACSQLLGYKDSSMFIGKNMHQLIHHSHADGSPIPEEACRIYRAFRESRGEHADNEVLWRADGTCFPAEYWSFPQIYEGKVKGTVVTFVDITERKKTEEKILHMATHDGLTDLPSLRLAKDRLSMAMSTARRNKTLAALMFVDLDSFKNINDTLGHDAGDYVLKQVAQRLLSSVREVDTVARVGGDEFLVIVSGLHVAENAELIAEKILKALAAPLMYKTQPLIIGASIGISLYPADGLDIESLIKQADKAMYEVKASGKNRYSFVKAGKYV